MCHLSGFQLQAISMSPLGSAKYRVQYQPTPPVLHLQPCNNEPENSVTSTRPLPMGQSSTRLHTRKAIAHFVWWKGSSSLTALSDRNGASELWNANSCCRLVAYGKKGVNDMGDIFLQYKDCWCATKKRLSKGFVCAEVNSYYASLSFFVFYERCSFFQICLSSIFIFFSHLSQLVSNTWVVWHSWVQFQLLSLPLMFQLTELQHSTHPAELTKGLHLST